MSTKKEDLHCGVPIPARDAPQLAWIEFNDQFERNMAWANTLLERPAAILRQWLDFDFDCPEEDYDEDTDTFEGEGNAEIRLRGITLAFLEERSLQKDQGDVHAETTRLGMRDEDIEREQRPLLARLRAGDTVDLKIIPPQPGFYWLRVRLHLRGQPAGWNAPEVGQLRVDRDGECTWDVCGSEQGLNDGEFEILSERLAFAGET